jgi:mannose/fructose-specific phosphotransferase system component IIA
MVGIVVVGHGGIGEEAVRTLQSVVGTMDAFEAGLIFMFGCERHL